MIRHPYQAQRVQIWYKDRTMPYHAKIATVDAAAGKGRGPRNHLVRLYDGTGVVVPAGNLRVPK